MECFFFTGGIPYSLAEKNILLSFLYFDKFDRDSSFKVNELVAAEEDWVGDLMNLTIGPPTVSKIATFSAGDNSDNRRGVVDGDVPSTDGGDGSAFPHVAEKRNLLLLHRRPSSLSGCLAPSSSTRG